MSMLVVSFFGGAVSYFAIHSPNAIEGGCSHRQVECSAQLFSPGRTNVTEKWETVGKCKRKLPACYESAVLHNPYLGCKHNVKEVPLAWQQLQFFCYLLLFNRISS